MPQRSNVLLKINVAITECVARLNTDTMEKLLEFARTFHDLNPFATTAMHRLY